MTHDDLGHSGSARTYAILRRLYYGKRLMLPVYKYVKQWYICKQRNRQIVKYA